MLIWSILKHNSILSKAFVSGHGLRTLSVMVCLGVELSNLLGKIFSGMPVSIVY
jgi:hypothetical protein